MASSNTDVGKGLGNLSLGPTAGKAPATLLESLADVLGERAPMRPRRREDAKELAHGGRTRRDYECDFEEIEIGDD